MNFTKKLLTSAAAVGMAAVCLGNAALSAMANDGLMLGDLNNDGVVNASDAAKVLIAAASLGAGQGSGLTEAQELCADVNDDGIINASDAAQILIYAAYIGAGGSGSLYDYLHKDDATVVWSVKSYQATPGQPLTIPVTIPIAEKGMNSYTAQLYADPGLTVTKIENGTAYPDMGFVANLDDLSFAGTNYSTSEDLMAAQDSVLCYVTIMVPENATPSDTYQIGFLSATASDYSMNTYTPDTYGAAITVMG
ncbi:MAG: hypothetical protein K5695_07530 [Oscillospiraceae bacterium]|nr:hypothetical protein [Oscillospiraceae bacterium]